MPPRPARRPIHVLAAKAPDGTPGLIVWPAADYVANLVDERAWAEAVSSAPFWEDPR